MPVRTWVGPWTGAIGLSLWEMECYPPDKSPRHFDLLTVQVLYALRPACPLKMALSASCQGPTRPTTNHHMGQIRCWSRAWFRCRWKLETPSSLPKTFAMVGIKLYRACPEKPFIYASLQQVTSQSPAHLNEEVFVTLQAWERYSEAQDP